jgi:hypothetical protein
MNCEERNRYCVDEMCGEAIAVLNKGRHEHLGLASANTHKRNNRMSIQNLEAKASVATNHHPADVQDTF